MKSSTTLRRENYKKSIRELLDTKPEAHKVENRYRVMLYLLNKEWPSLIQSKEAEYMKEFLKDVVYIDRKIRLETEGEQEEEKEILSQEFQLNELGVEVNYQGNINKLETL